MKKPIAAPSSFANRKGAVAWAETVVSGAFNQHGPHYSDIYFRNSFVQDRPDSRRMTDCRTTASFRHLDRVGPLFLAALFWQAVQHQWPPSTWGILPPAAPFRLRGLPPRCSGTTGPLRPGRRRFQWEMGGLARWCSAAWKRNGFS